MLCYCFMPLDPDLTRAQVEATLPFLAAPKGRPFGWMDAATRSLAEHLSPGTLVSYETTLPVGTGYTTLPTVSMNHLPGFRNVSAFGEDFKWISYPKADFSWVVDEESFWPSNRWVNTLRVRGAYGESGRAPAT